MSSDGTMVIAGEDGGKSTFIGALITYVSDIKGQRYQGDHNVVYGSENAFDQDIYERMQSQFAYPRATPRLDRYAVRVITNADDGYAARNEVTMMDIPGEIQQDAVNRLERGKINEETIREAYNQGIQGDPIRKKVDKSESLTDDEEEMLYLYQYVSANKVILLLNLEKFINPRPGIDPILSTKLIERVASERQCLLLVTAADEIGYDPDSFRSGFTGNILSILSLSSNFFDVGLAEYLKKGNNLPPGHHASDIRRLVRTAQNNDASMFSIAVPGETDNDIQVEGGSIRTEGFHNLVDWLYK